MLKNRVVRNASWIISCRIIQAILNLFISMLSARYLGPANFGLINYAISVVSFATPIMQLGFNSIIVNELIDNPDKEGKILGTALFLNLCMAIFTLIGVTLFVCCANFNEKTTIIVCVLYSTILFSQALEIIQYWYQAKLLSKYTSIVSLIAYVIVSLYKIILLVKKMSIYYFAVSNALDYFLIGIILLILYKKIGTQKLEFSLQIGKKLFNKGKYYIVSSLMVTIFAQTDKIMLKMMINDKATGYYSAAITCATITSFIFVAIIDSIRPIILENKKKNNEIYELNICRLYSIVIWLSILQSIGTAIFSKLIVNILYGAKYSETIKILRVVVWYSTFSYLGSVRNIWILAENKQRFVSIINLFGAIANVILNFILIPIIGIMGAAIASLITQIFTNVIIGFIIKEIRYNNKLMILGFNPKYFINTLKKIKV